MREVHSAEELEAALRAPVALLFKHSTACAISAMAQREVARVAQLCPDVPVCVVDVHAQRTLSNQLADRLDIIHHSPQAILVCGGAPVWHASHFAITRAVVEAQLVQARGRTGADSAGHAS